MTVLQVCAYAAEYPGNFIRSLELLESELKKLGHDTVYAFPEAAKAREWCKSIENRTAVYYLPESKARIRPSTYIKMRKIDRGRYESI